LQTSFEEKQMQLASKILAMALVENSNILYQLLNCSFCLGFWLALLASICMAISLSLSFLFGFILATVSVATTHLLLKIYFNPNY
jgi:hypothetical protein